MRFLQKFARSTAVALTIALGACGGGGATGGGGGLNSTPTPTPTPTPSPTPTPTPAATPEIFQAPATQEFATAGAPLRIRYDAVARVYEVMAPGENWQPLTENPHYVSTGGQPDPYFAFSRPNKSDDGFLTVGASYRSADPAFTYQYSNLALWGAGIGAYWDKADYTAFGMATAPGGVPVTGTGNYQGQILGASTISEPDYLIGTNVDATVHGTVVLQFDFGAGSLSGNIAPILETFGGSINLGTLQFADTVFASGSQNFSGKFDSNLSGPNSFSGLFTGPAAQELIGQWSFPFTYPVDGTLQSATGAWIAKRN